MEYYDHRGQLVRIANDGSTGRMPEYAVTVDGADVGRITREGPTMWAYAAKGLHGFADCARAAADALVRYAWHYSSPWVY